MSSILNSISSGDLLVLDTPRETPIKKDSIIELLQNSEIEFDYIELEKLEPVIPKPKLEIVNVDITCEKEPNNNTLVDISELLKNSEIKLVICPTPQSSVDDFNTGFGNNNDLHYKTPCVFPKLKTPLYLENYLREFKTEEEKAAARHALGLYNKEDIVALSLLTTKDSLPTTDDWNNSSIKLLRQGDVFFTPITSTSSVFNSEGKTLDTVLHDVNLLIVALLKQLTLITQVSQEKTITSLGDVNAFLQGFNNGDNLYKTLDNMNQEMLRFEKTGLIMN